MSYNLNKKSFRVVSNQGPGAAVNTETTFKFWQINNIVHGDYQGGGVYYGKLAGLLNGNSLIYRYVQVTLDQQIQSGESVNQIETAATGKIRLIDHWEWADGSGTGNSILEEIVD